MTIKDQAGIVEQYFLGPVITGKNIIISQNLGDITFENIQKYLINFTTASQGNTYTIFTRINPSTFLRTATTVVKEDGTYAVNSTLSTDSLAYKQLVNGLSYSGIVELYGKTFYGYYSPIFEPSTNAVIGAFFVAYPIDSVVTNSVPDILVNGNLLLSVITGPVFQVTTTNTLVTKNQGDISFQNYEEILINLTSQCQCEFTLFSRSGNDFIRTATTIVDESDNYAVETTLSRDSHAYEPILNGESYTGEVILFDNPYYSSYSPIFDSFTGLVIGIYFSGYPF